MAPSARRADPRAATTPLYNRIAADLRDQIDAGQLRPHTRLPSERQLSQKCHVARMTVRQALELLEHEGLVYRRAGLGSFVAEPRIGVRVGSFSEEVLRAGRSPSARILRAERIWPSAFVAEALGLEPDEEVLITQRLRLADNEPLAIETSHWAANRMPDLLENLVDGSLWAVVRELYGVEPTASQARLEAIALDANASQRLGAKPKSPGFLLSRWTFDQRGRCFEFARDVYRGDRAEFRIQTPVSPAHQEPGSLLSAKSAG